MRSLLISFVFLFSLNAFSMGKNKPHPPGPVDPAPGVNEPAYCSLANLKKVEIQSGVSGLKAPHVYKIGNITVAGLGVGNSKFASVKQLAAKYSSSTAEDGYCTWYFNDGNTEAQNAFNWHYVPRPNSDPKKAVKDYAVLMNEFDTSKNNFVRCAETRGYLAMGCDGMKHRGPSVFAMLLTYSGCSAKSAVDIANAVWGTNTISTESRIALANEAAKLAVAHPEQAGRLQRQFLGAAQ
jgi:hypothetical protein